MAFGNTGQGGTPSGIYGGLTDAQLRAAPLPLAGTGQVATATRTTAATFQPTFSTLGFSRFSASLSGASFSITGSFEWFDGTNWRTLGFQPSDGGPVTRGLNGFTQAAVASYSSLVGLLPPGAVAIRCNPTAVTGSVDIRLSVDTSSALPPTQIPPNRRVHAAAQSAALANVVAPWERWYVQSFRSTWNLAPSNANNWASITVAGVVFYSIAVTPSSSGAAGGDPSMYMNFENNPLVSPYGSQLASAPGWPSSASINASAGFSL